MTNEVQHTHISAEHKWFQLNLREVFRYRDLIWLFTTRSFTVSYKQTILGPAWLFINPFISSVMYTIVFGQIAKLSTDGIPQILFYLCGNAIWGFFSNSLTNNSGTFVGNAYLFGKVYFPRLTMPISSMLTGVIRFGIQMILVLGFLIYYAIIGAVSPHWWAWLLVPFILLHLGLMGKGSASSFRASRRNTAISPCLSASACRSGCTERPWSTPCRSFPAILFWNKFCSLTP